MSRFLVERLIPRAGELTAQELKAISQQIMMVQQEMEAHIQWIHSAITADRMVCLYVADDESAVREHSRRSGLPIQRISEVSAIIGPLLDEASSTPDMIEASDVTRIELPEDR
jgi:hypothetical protein